MAHGGEQVCVGQGAAEQQVAVGGSLDHGHARVGVEQPGEARQAEAGVAVAAERAQDETLSLPQVAVRAASPHPGQAAQPGGGEVPGVAFALLWPGVGAQQGVAVLGDEAEQQPVDQAQQGAVVLLVGEPAIAQRAAQRLVAGWRRKPVPSAARAFSTPSRSRSSARAPASTASPRQVSSQQSAGDASAPPRFSSRETWQSCHISRNSGYSSPSKIASRSNSR